MSTREDIASNLVTVIGSISSPSVRKVTRQPFQLDELSQAQYPAVLIQTIEETKEDQEIGSGAKTRICTLEFGITGYVKGSESNIDTARNNLASAIETALETDAGSLFPYGAVLITVRVIYDHQAATP